MGAIRPLRSRRPPPGDMERLSCPTIDSACSRTHPAAFPRLHRVSFRHYFRLGVLCGLAETPSDGVEGVCAALYARGVYAASDRFVDTVGDDCWTQNNELEGMADIQEC